MPNIWPHVTKQEPCGICKKGDWCQVGDHGWRCYRVESSKPFKTGGWFHAFDGSREQLFPKPKPLPPPPLVNFAKLMREWKSVTGQYSMECEAQHLGVSRWSLESLGMVLAQPHRAFGFPMRDGYGEIVGIRLRSNDGRKWAVRGSKNGLFIPSIDPKPIVYLCEGPTSTAAALTIGLYALGRPACHLGGSDLKVALRRLGVKMAVIVADNDEKPSGLTPGLTGAQLLQKEVGVKSVIWTPPTKDVRDFVRAGGTRDIIESDLKNFVWRIYK